MKLSWKLPPTMDIEGIRAVKISKDYTVEDATMEELAEQIDDLEAINLSRAIAKKIEDNLLGSNGFIFLLIFSNSISI